MSHARIEREFSHPHTHILLHNHSRNSFAIMPAKRNASASPPRAGTHPLPKKPKPAFVPFASHKVMAERSAASHNDQSAQVEHNDGDEEANEEYDADDVEDGEIVDGEEDECQYSHSIVTLRPTEHVHYR